MSDLLKDVNFLRYYHTSDDMLKDKDYNKNLLQMSYKNKVSAIMFVPFVAQVYQLSLTGHPELLQRYKTVRMFKTVTLAGGLAFSMYELSNLKRKWKYIDRLYPEPTQLQKRLELEAMQYKENKVKVLSVEERMQLLENPNLLRQYSQFYQLPPQRHKDEWTDYNAPEHK